VRLPTPVANEAASLVLRRCIQAGLLPAGPLPDWSAFEAFRSQVRGSFQVPETSITPLIARVLYGISALARPARILGVGTYAGNALVWLVGPGFGARAVYPGERAVGVDVDAQATELALRNFRSLGTDSRVQLLCEDGHTIPARLESLWDLILLDADDGVTGKRIYLSLLEAVYAWLRTGGLLLAHDICVPKFRDALATYQAAVRSPDRFRASLSLEVDSCGLEISLKATARSEETHLVAAGSIGER
jgi:predicted O-methyltransferase YrrM